MKEPWTVERFIELLKRHDLNGGRTKLFDVVAEMHGNDFYVRGWLNIENLVAELNERNRQ